MTGERTVGGYRLLRVIGEGGMGVVHLALDPSDRAVAVKVVRPHVAADPETRARLAREVRSLLRVRHPRVAEVLDADFDAELPYVVMRYVPGEALDAVVRRDGPLTGAALDELAVGLFEAVAAVHAVGVVHRDLKPGNVLLLDGSPVVIDFGIARALDDVALTSTGLMVGTPGYLSPEVLDGTDVGTAADWWGWGAVVAFGATGRAPFRGGPLEAVWDRVRRGAVDLDGVDERWAGLLRATLRPDPADRPSPEQLAEEVVALTGRRPELPAAARALAAGSAGAATRSQPRPQAARPAEPLVTPTTVQARPASEAPREGRRPAARTTEPDPVTRVVRRPPPPAPAAQPVRAPASAGPAQTAALATAPLGTPCRPRAPLLSAPLRSAPRRSAPRPPGGARPSPGRGRRPRSRRARRATAVRAPGRGRCRTPPTPSRPATPRPRPHGGRTCRPVGTRQAAPWSSRACPPRAPRCRRCRAGPAWSCSAASWSRRSRRPPPSARRRSCSRGRPSPGPCSGRGSPRP